MSHHPPIRLIADMRRTSLASIDNELLQEKASALGRLGRRLEAALAALAAFDAAPAHTSVTDRSREPLLAAAADAFWNLLVQREACGFRNEQAVVEDYKVPADVYRRAGVGPLPRVSGSRLRRRRNDAVDR